MRYFFNGLIGILLIGLAFSCDSHDRQPQVLPPQISPTQETIPQDTGNVAVIAGADTTIQSNRIMEELIPSLSVPAVMQALPEAEITRNQPYPNRHNSQQIDTLITIKSDSSIFQFYRVQGKDLLQSATLTTAGVKMGGGLEIGMTAEEVANVIPSLQVRNKAVPQTILIRAEQTPIALRLRFDKNRLEYMHFDGYVD